MENIKNEFIFHKEIKTLKDVEEWIEDLKNLPLSDIKEVFELINYMREKELKCRFKDCIYGHI